MNNGVDLLQSKAEAESMMQVAKATIASVKDTKEKLQDEKARLMDLEQEVTLRERMAEKLIKVIFTIITLCKKKKNRLSHGNV